MCPCLLHYQYNLLPTEFHKPLHNLGLLINIQRQPNAFPFLSTGENVSGQVAIEVQESAVNIRVQYQISSFGDNSVYWIVPSE